MANKIRWKKVAVKTDISRVTAWRLERLGLFPRRLQLSPGAVGWDEGEVLDWVENLPRVGGIEIEQQVNMVIGSTKKAQ